MIVARFKMIAALMCAAALLLLAGAPSRGQLPKDKLPPEIAWKLTALSKDPIKVVATQYDPKLRTILWTLELTRDLEVNEDLLYWAPAFRFERRPLVRFEFQGMTGINLKTMDCRYVGEYANKKGKRFGALLIIPDEALPATKTVQAIIS